MRPWSSVVEDALYGPSGFYTTGGGAERHFLTSPSLGSLFGRVIARAVAGADDVVEVGGGTGVLGAAVVAALDEPARYTLVERSAALRTAAASRLTSAEVVASLPAAVRGVIFGNELLDNLPFDIYERSGDGWSAVMVDDAGEVSVPADSSVAARLSGLAPHAPVGARVPWMVGAQAWLTGALSVLLGGRLILFDYGRTTADLAAEGGWLRTYRAGGRGGPALEDLGSQDITTDVAYDQLTPAPVATRQRDWLRAHGLDDLIAPARARVRLGDRDLRSLALLSEAAALTDPAGLGDFVVMQWDVP